MTEVALALILLICASLLIQTFARLGRVETGMRTENLFTARINLPEAAYPRPANIIAFFDQLLAEAPRHSRSRIGEHHSAAAAELEVT